MGRKFILFEIDGIGGGSYSLSEVISNSIGDILCVVIALIVIGGAGWLFLTLPTPIAGGITIPIVVGLIVLHRKVFDKPLGITFLEGLGSLLIISASTGVFALIIWCILHYIFKLPVSRVDALILGFAAIIVYTLWKEVWYHKKAIYAVIVFAIAVAAIFAYKFLSSIGTA